MVKSCNWPAAYNSFEIFPLSVSDRRVVSPETLSTGDIDFLETAQVTALQYLDRIQAGGAGILSR